MQPLEFSFACEGHERCPIYHSPLGVHCEQSARCTWKTAYSVIKALHASATIECLAQHFYHIVAPRVLLHHAVMQSATAQQSSKASTVVNNHMGK